MPHAGCCSWWSHRSALATASFRCVASDRQPVSTAFAASQLRSRHECAADVSPPASWTSGADARLILYSGTRAGKLRRATASAATGACGQSFARGIVQRVCRGVLPSSSPGVCRQSRSYAFFHPRFPQCAKTAERILMRQYSFHGGNNANRHTEFSHDSNHCIAKHRPSTVECSLRTTMAFRPPGAQTCHCTECSQ